MRAGSGVARAAVWLVTLALLSGGDALAQTGLKISGMVEDAAGDPVADLRVVFTPVDSAGNPTDGVVGRVKTNKKGKFTFGFARAGDYTISVESEELQLTAATVRMRDADRKPVYGPDGPIEDRTAPVDPNRPVVGLGIPGEAYLVDVDLVVGEPSAAVASGPAAADIGAQLAASNLGAEVDALLVRLEARQFDAVAGGAEALIAENPDVAALHYLLGYALVKLERLAEAEASLRAALALAPEIAGASGLLGQILAEGGRYEEAIPALRHEIELADRSTPRAPLLLALGQALLEVDRVEEAVAALEASRELDPNNDVTRVQLVDAYTRSGREADAERLLGEGLDPASAAILHFNLAANLLRDERWQAGIDHMRQALELDPTLGEAHKYVAQGYLAQGRQAEAIAEFRAYVSAVPTASDAAQITQIIEALERNSEGN